MRPLVDRFTPAGSGSSVSLPQALVWTNRHATGNKKADVTEHPKVFGHVGLLVNEPLGRAELLFI